MDEPTSTVALFSYGTLRQPEVQLGTYGHLVESEDDVLTGYVLAEIVIDDPEVVALSGKSVHTIARRTGNPEDVVRGCVLLLTPSELAATDAYEAAAYARTQERLKSGRTAFVYVDVATTTR